ncbi:hypothetical protein ALC62_15731, partial [Cyphomyrmex costatus]
FAISKGRNVGVSRKIGGTKECGRAAMDFARTSLLKEEAVAAKPRTGLGGVTRGVVPPLTNTWKQGSRSRTGERERVNRQECTRPTSFPPRNAHRTRSPHVLIPLEHVPLRTQVSSVTRPGDMGTSSAKVNGLFRCSTTPSARHAWVCTRAYVVPGGCPSSFASIPWSAPVIDMTHVIASANARRGDTDQRTGYASLLCCAAARHLAVRADSLPRDEMIATPRNARAHARIRNAPLRLLRISWRCVSAAACSVHNGTIYRI